MGVRHGTEVQCNYELNVYDRKGNMVTSMNFPFEPNDFVETRQAIVTEASRLRSLGYTVYGFVNRKFVEQLEWL